MPINEQELVRALKANNQAVANVAAVLPWFVPQAARVRFSALFGVSFDEALGIAPERNGGPSPGNSSANDLKP